MTVNEPKPPRADLAGVVTVLVMLPIWWARAVFAGKDPHGVLAQKEGALVKAMILSLCCWGFLVIAVVTAITHSNETAAPYATSSPVDSRDQAAYRELRRRGLAEDDAAKAAPSLRRLCEAGGGNDCR